MQWDGPHWDVLIGKETKKLQKGRIPEETLEFLVIWAEGGCNY